MNQTVLSNLEKSIFQLPTDEQLLLISRVAERLRTQSENIIDFEAQLISMANDEDIQLEIRSIERDFTLTELDGLAG